MRPIKFRAWDGKKMSGSFGVGSLLVGTWVDATLMQFTGLHDAKGREIYCGDWVKDGDGINHLVEWGHVGFKPFCVIDREGAYQSANIGDVDYLCRASDVEIIGNIHEHPHLLQGKA